MRHTAWWVPLLWWVWGGVAVTGVCGLVLIAVQQNLRQAANDPQIQMAEDAAARLAGGEAPAALAERGSPPVDIGGSLVPWLAVYDQSGTPVVASAVLNNVLPQLPAGVFEAVTNGTGKDTTRFGEDRITWQPQEGVRQAVVVVAVPDKKYFVAAGRNLREVEVREGNLRSQVVAAYLATLLALLVASYLVWFLLRTPVRK